MQARRQLSEEQQRARERGSRERNGLDDERPWLKWVVAKPAKGPRRRRAKHLGR